MLLFSCFLFFCTIYCAIILVFVLNWKRHSGTRAKSSSEIVLSISLLIPVRNEAENVAKLMQFILEQSSKFKDVEVILIDDGSVDDTVLIAKNIFPSLKVLHVDELAEGYWVHAPKKSALTQGIAMATGDILVFIDGDCTPVHSAWLDEIRKAFQGNDLAAITAPVILNTPTGFFEYFQQLELLAWTVVTSGGYDMKWFTLANGGNMAVRRKVFYEVGGFAGTDKYASGDDVFLMEKLQKNNFRVQSLWSYEVLVTTQGVASWSAYFNQKVRWGSKTAGSSSLGLQLVAGVMLFVNFMIYPILTIGILKGNLVWMLSVISAVIVKFVFDDWMIRNASARFKVEIPLLHAFCAHFIYPISIVVSLFQTLWSRNYQWKGRNLK